MYNIIDLTINMNLILIYDYNMLIYDCLSYII